MFSPGCTGDGETVIESRVIWSFDGEEQSLKPAGKAVDGSSMTSCGAATISEIRVAKREIFIRF